jgi:hypothetical protein
MNFDDWLMVVGETETRNWNGREYQFRVGKGHSEANPIIRDLNSNTPMKSLIEKSVQDGRIRGLLFLSYYLVNPTFRKEGPEAGANYFCMPLDRLTDKQHNRIAEELEDDADDEEDDEEGEEEEEEFMADFPLMSSVGEPVIDAATSDSYAKKLDRKSDEKRVEILQEEIKQKQEERIERVEDWLEEGMDSDEFQTHFPAITEATGLMPTLLLMGLIKDEKSRFQKIHDRIDDLDLGFVERDEGLLNVLNNLSKDVGAIENYVIEGFCLDEKNTGCEYHIAKHRGLELNSDFNQCESCGSQLFRVYRAGLEDTVRDAWMMGLLPELATAATLRRCGWVDEVIPHRLVQMKTEDGLTSSEEVDVVVHTESDHVLFFEVTSQSENAMSRVNPKRQKFEQSGIEYDGLIQLSLANNREFILFDESTLVGGGWMIPNIESREFHASLTEKLDLA